MNWFKRLPGVARAPWASLLAASLWSMAMLLSSQAAAGDAAGPFVIDLRGKAFDERCFNLSAGDSVRYRFTASAVVDFNIHYHRGDEVIYPLKQASVRNAESSFRAEIAQDYCLMWENHGQTGLSVRGSIDVVRSRTR